MEKYKYKSMEYLNKEDKKNWKAPSEEEMKVYRKRMLKENGNEWYVKAFTTMNDKLRSR